MSIFDKIESFTICRDVKDNQRTLRRKSGMILGMHGGTFIPIMYLSKPKYVADKEFQELLDCIDIQFIKKTK